MNLAKKIIEKKVACVFISPHQDDAILSCGELISQISGKTDVTVVNVFTKAHEKPYTLSAKQFLKNSYSSDAETLYKERKAEDKKVLSNFSVSIIDLNFQDALFRKNKKSSFLGTLLPEVDHIYPTYRWHIVKGISKRDYAVDDLKKKLKIFTKKNTLIFAPVGIGNHADHLAVRKACEEICASESIVLYSDFPYNMRLQTIGAPFKNGEKYIIEPNMTKKTKLIKGYKTQLDGLFPDGIIPQHKEVYFTK